MFSLTTSQKKQSVQQRQIEQQVSKARQTRKRDAFKLMGSTKNNERAQSYASKQSVISKSSFRVLLPLILAFFQSICKTVPANSHRPTR